MLDSCSVSCFIQQLDMSQNHFYPLVLCCLFVCQSLADHDSFRTNGNLGFPNSGKNGLPTTVNKLDFSQNSWLNAVADNRISLLLCFFHSSTFCVTCQDASFSCHVILTAFSISKCWTLEQESVQNAPRIGSACLSISGKLLEAFFVKMRMPGVIMVFSF